jgi:hypothetical protein
VGVSINLVFTDTEPIFSLVMAIKKIRIDEALWSKPIPTLSDKQFVVAQSSLSQREEQAQRELFWYREELFKCVRGRWREVRLSNSLTKLSTYIEPKTGGTRSGVLSFRAQRMTLPMLEAFRREIAHITLTLLSTRELSEGVPSRGAQFYPQANEFVQLTMKVTNLTRMSTIVLF